MADIYKLQYNGMTLAYPGWNGYVSYEAKDEPISSDTYTLLWEGTAYNNIVLSKPYTDFDGLMFVGNQNLFVSKDKLVVNNGRVDLTVPINKKALGTDTPYFCERAQKINITDGVNVNAVSSFAASWYPNQRWNNNLYFNWYKIFGVKYAE